MKEDYEQNLFFSWIDEFTKQQILLSKIQLDDEIPESTDDLEPLTEKRSSMILDKTVAILAVAVVAKKSCQNFLLSRKITVATKSNQLDKKAFANDEGYGEEHN